MEAQDNQTGGAWWKHLFGIEVRVVIYLLLIGILAYGNCRSRATPPLLPTLDQTASERRLNPEAAGAGKTVNLSRLESEDEARGKIASAACYPKVTFYAWTRIPLADGGQEIRIMVRFLENHEHIQWQDLQLFSAARTNAPLAVMTAPAGRSKPSGGMELLSFRLPPHLPEFESGRVFCWNADLVNLGPDRYLAPAAFEGGWRQVCEEEGRGGVAAPAAPGGRSGPD